MAEPTYDPSRYRRCPVCRQDIGMPCMALNSRIDNGRPDGLTTVLAVPHKARKLRTRWAKR